MPAYFGAIIRKRREEHERREKAKKPQNMMPANKSLTYNELIARRKFTNQKKVFELYDGVSANHTKIL
tara:strand:- start:124 stop:327 length:204 start_codon:yes stop_codon:yes gene_type:complete